MDMIEVAERLSAVEKSVSILEQRQDRQNGNIQRLEESLDDKILALEAKLDDSTQRLGEKLDRFYLWLVGLMGGVIASLILLLVNIGLGR